MDEFRKAIDSMGDLIAADFNAGYMSKDEVIRQLQSAWGKFRETVAELRLKSRASLNAKTMLRFSLDYKAWANGGEPNSKEGEPWLIRIEGRSWTEASVEEKAAYFTLARDAFVPLYYREFPPAGMEVPARSVGGHHGNIVGLSFDCIDDGGLADCEDPRGKRFALADAKGQHAMIQVESRAGYEYRPAWGKGAEYAGLVWVEGYTVGGLNSKGHVGLHGGKVTSIDYINDETNETAYRSYPRWQPYFNWVQEHPPQLLTPSFEEYVNDFMSQRGDWEPVATGTYYSVA